MRRALVDLRASLRIYFRSRSGVFWTIAFPVLMMLVFGSILGNAGDDVTLGFQDRDGTPASQAFRQALADTGSFDLRTIPAGEDAVAASRREGYHTVVVVPPGYAAALQQGEAVVRIHHDPSQTNSNIAFSVVRGVVDRMNLELAGARSPAVQLAQESLVSSELSFVDFFLPGVIGMTIAMSALIGNLELFARYRSQGILKKLATTPITKLEWVVSKVLYQCVIGAITATTIIVVGVLAFDVRVFLNPFAILILFSGTAAFAGLSMMIARYVNEQESANAAGSAVAMPMIFLSGTFFPLEGMPPLLHSIAKVLPLTYVNEGLRAAMITQNASAMAFNGAIAAALAIGFVLLGAAMTDWKEV
ncbi:MAG TPA: ABC transporter permease [Candidatus Thermoplasmatota archaeon]|nr:ABC transporter permease [Candidatus Thermoplasmatota archaeon]